MPVGDIPRVDVLDVVDTIDALDAATHWHRSLPVTANKIIPSFREVTTR